MSNNSIYNLKEDANHGDFMLPFTTYIGWMSPSYTNVPLHWHKEMEITFIEEGTAYYNIDLVSYEFKKGTLLFVHPHQLHSLTYKNNTPSKWVTMVFSLDLLKSSSLDAVLIKYILPLTNSEHTFPLAITPSDFGYSELLSTFQNAIDCYTKKNIAYELEIKSLLYKFIGELYKNNLIIKDKFFSNNISAPHVEKIKVVLNYIHANYDQDISIKSLASLCSFSEYYFMRFFKKSIGMTCIQYINSYRLEKACILLASTNKTIMEIALDVGFDNLSYFIKTFKCKYNITPKQYRKTP